ncbi:MAG: sugar transferase [Caldilineaceae bacterium]
MKDYMRWLIRLYALLLRLYPRRHRLLFAKEMQLVFAQALVECATQGWWAVISLCGREVRDLPHLLLREYWSLWQQWLRTRVSAHEARRTDLPGIVPVGVGSLPHVVFVVTGRNPWLRRLFDLCFALAGLAITAPLLLILPLLIKLDSAGPIFYRQPRLGKDGRPYLMYKFRSMHVEPQLQAAYAAGARSSYDRRLTRIGRWTRRYYLDELPQLFNVLKGEMSIFGPRPPLPGQ